MSYELRACECGWKWPIESVDEAHHYVACYQCGRRGPHCETESDAIAAWNRRVVTREQVEKMASDIAWIDYDDARMPRAGLARCILRAAGFEVAE